jgi:hypothetical protein
MEESVRLPRCPNCREPGIYMRGDWFRCECGSVWLQSGWQNQLDDEAAQKKERERMNNINFVVSIGGIFCDECHKAIQQGERYAVKQEKTTKMRVCAKCSLTHRWLVLVEDPTTKERFYARGASGDEKVVNKSLGEWKRPHLRVQYDKYNRICRSCHKPSAAVSCGEEFSPLSHVRYVQCTSPSCYLYLVTQETIDTRVDETDLPDMRRGSLCKECKQTLGAYKKVVTETEFQYVFKCTDWHCKSFAKPQGVLQVTN